MAHQSRDFRIKNCYGSKGGEWKERVTGRGEKYGEGESKRGRERERERKRWRARRGDGEGDEDMEREREDGHERGMDGTSA